MHPHRVALALASLVAGAGLLQAQTPARPPTVAVMYFNNSALTANAEYEPLRVGMADILITELQSNPRITLIERDALQKLLEEQDLVKEKRTDPATSARLGKILGAQHMILGGFLIDRGGTLRVDARAVNVETSEVVYTESAQGKADDLLQVIAELARKLNSGLKLPGRVGEVRPPAPSPSTETRPAAQQVSPFKAMQTFARALVAEDGKDRAQALALYRQFLNETSVTFAVAQRAKAEKRIQVLSGAGD
jgi:TolB-like protein